MENNSTLIEQLITASSNLPGLSAFLKSSVLLTNSN